MSMQQISKLLIVGAAGLVLLALGLVALLRPANEGLIALGSDPQAETGGVKEPATGPSEEASAGESEAVEPTTAEGDSATEDSGCWQDTEFEQPEEGEEGEEGRQKAATPEAALRFVQARLEGPRGRSMDVAQLEPFEGYNESVRQARIEAYRGADQKGRSGERTATYERRGPNGVVTARITAVEDGGWSVASEEVMLPGEICHQLDEWREG